MHITEGKDRKHAPHAHLRQANVAVSSGAANIGGLGITYAIGAGITQTQKPRNLSMKPMPPSNSMKPMPKRVTRMTPPPPWGELVEDAADEDGALTALAIEDAAPDEAAPPNEVKLNMLKKLKKRVLRLENEHASLKESQSRMRDDMEELRQYIQYVEAENTTANNKVAWLLHNAAQWQ